MTHGESAKPIGPNTVWAEPTRAVVREGWAAGSDEIDIAFAANEVLGKLHRAEGRAKVPQASPRGVLYEAAKLGLITAAELSARVEATGKSKWKRDYRARRKAMGIVHVDRRFVLTVKASARPLEGGGEVTCYRSVVTGPVWVRGFVRDHSGGDRSFALAGCRDSDWIGPTMDMTEAAFRLLTDFQPTMLAMCNVGWTSHGCRKLRAFWKLVTDGVEDYDGFHADVTRKLNAMHTTPKPPESKP